MDSYRKPAVNRYWKRPKPKVYDCNVRDAERFYQQSYRDYLSEKEAQAAKARSVDREPTFYAHLRAGPLRRESSKPPPLPPSYKSAREAREASAESSTSTKLTSLDTLSTYDPAKESASLDERLARIKKLREELGLPGETQNVSRVTSSLTRETRGGASSDFESSFKSEKTSRANGLSSSLGGGEDSSYSFKSERSRPGADDSSYSFKSERSSNLSRPGADDSSYSFKSERTSSYSRPGADDSSYSFKSERTSRASAANGLSNDDYSFKSERKVDDYKPSPKFERKKLDLDLGSKMSPKLDRKNEDYSFSKLEKKSDFSSKSSAAASSSASTRARKNIVESLDFDDDDTDILKTMKKLPSSQEILERISKMDLDD